MTMTDGTSSYPEEPLAKTSALVRYFFDRSFFHYLWTGGTLMVAQVFFLWVFIDVLRIPTVISSVVVVGGLLIVRYTLLRLLKVIA
ncbi:MAG: hypothetical protein A3I44_05935 [Candidatus Sungbacteria bacterium RIFCSPLOWO2_02_FULL_51_17]|uniref:Uncharacterized protein n=1 Tax=Candidatus Sungbacteria bacterium RIFCSPHIGHO2_02_FULL_51_29 TaxID=1802273 RepID=A0A1G2KQY7_9BACT|nr:MAG: hypothetical protein A2676_01460 [Candidatus Sungbacteria bacterium RIFCSPHIGHO2_01_FULL_51_22]OHA01847.1 MAG: hypothetical protein A3C16_06045 [Candidatus Sungbacteria bacterium RIFCSPHIGHO2_02_FULL_51_29]OHA06925.1 MAG: hypothetical protein A3B29_04880 [Candidatus Sungbacteria bacterium RIFCSPLOWO2_01_FULL_51_34]OHA12389.1 MAG: hypothetical protein A3I44_05935 [Candidatus Sungbacteria bacterium RIFCSPLOWO2_02_FULL_51_17]